MPVYTVFSIEDNGEGKNNVASAENMRAGPTTKAARRREKKEMRELRKGGEERGLLSISSRWTEKREGLRSASVDIG